MYRRICIALVAALAVGFVACRDRAVTTLNDMVTDKVIEVAVESLAQDIRAGDVGNWSYADSHGPTWTANMKARHAVFAEHLGMNWFGLVYDNKTDFRKRAMDIAREETFGPVAPITRIRGLDEAIGIVNASAFGLLTAIFTRDLKVGLRFAESVRAGWVNINEGTNYWESHLPFGGRAGSQSGLGRVGGRYLIERLTELKTVVINLA